MIDPLGLKPPKDIPPGVSMQNNLLMSRFMWKIDFYNSVKSGGKWDYKKLESKYENFGNYNYGATGCAVGFEPGTLRRAAGAYQKYTNTSRPDWGHPLGDAPYGDEPIDQYWINEGIKDYQNGYFK